MSSEEAPLTKEEPQVESSIETIEPPELPAQTKKAIKPRTVIRADPNQKYLLGVAFKKNTRPGPDEFATLSTEIGLSKKWIIGWFHRQRTKNRKRIGSEGPATSPEEVKTVKSECQDTETATAESTTNDASASPPRKKARKLCSDPENHQKKSNIAQKSLENFGQLLGDASVSNNTRNADVKPLSPSRQPQSVSLVLGNSSMGQPLPVSVPLARPIRSRSAISNSSPGAALMVPPTAGLCYSSGPSLACSSSSNIDIAAAKILAALTGDNIHPSATQEDGNKSNATVGKLPSSELERHLTSYHDPGAYHETLPDSSSFMRQLNELISSETQIAARNAGPASSSSSPGHSLGSTPVPVLPSNFNNLLQPVPPQSSWPDLRCWPLPLIAPVPHPPVPNIQVLNAQVENFQLNSRYAPSSQSLDFDISYCAFAGNSPDPVSPLDLDDDCDDMDSHQGTLLTTPLNSFIHDSTSTSSRPTSTMSGYKALLDPNLAPLKHLTVVKPYMTSSSTSAEANTTDGSGKGDCAHEIIDSLLDEGLVQRDPFQAAMGLVFLSGLGLKWDTKYSPL